MDWAIGFSVFIFGTLVGSFLNVLILRHGFHEAPRARSGCAACGTQLRWYELVPIVSFVALRARCTTCGSRLSLQYPLVELLTGALFVASFFTTNPLLGWFSFIPFLLLLLFWASFVLLVVYDLKHTLVPFAFSIPLIVSALLLKLFEAYVLASAGPIIDGALGALVFGGFLALLYVITRGKGMGLGDAYVGIALGVLFGLVQTFEVLALSFWIGAGVGIILLILKRQFTIKTEVPFVPFLFVATMIGLFTAFSPLNAITALFF